MKVWRGEGADSRRGKGRRRGRKDATLTFLFPSVLSTPSAPHSLLLPSLQFVEDVGTTRFYKNKSGVGKTYPVFQKESYSDSGVDVEEPVGPVDEFYQDRLSKDE